jgi:phosphoribosylformylglycinamidine synthase
MEGKFNLPEPEENYTIVSKYAYNSYPANLMVLILMRLCYVTTGRHLVMMPHIERSTFNGTGQIIQKIGMTKFRLGMKLL